MASVKQQKCETEHYHLDAMIDGRYRLTQFIGAGGMACVYRAKEEGSPHEFALKFLKSEYHNMPYLIEYFRDEASSMRDLAHPNIVRFYRFVNNEHYSYIIMDYVDGFALSEVIKLSRKKKDFMPLDEVARVMTQVARALDAIHREDYVHRDIKPSNVLIDRKTGRAFLTDLGITSASNTMMEGAGTMAYMSPEQAETWVADHRSDIYAYGIMLFEMLSSHRPFTVGKDLRGSMAEADLLRKHKEAEVPDITKYNHKLPKALNDILQKGLAKKPEDRYQNIMDFAREVHEVLKPQLSDDLQDFTQIKHRHIEAPVIRDDSRLLRVVLAVGVIIIFLAGFILYDATFNAPATPTPVPSPTPTVDPFVGQSDIALEQLQGLDALADRWDDEEIVLPALDYEPLHYLQINSIEGFRVHLNVAAANNLTAYGLAFRIQDAKNYHYFAINPRNNSWRFVEVTNGAEATKTTGEFGEELPNEFTISGINRGGEHIFRLEIGDSELATYISELYESGTLALYVKGQSGASLQLSGLDISLVGSNVQQATELQSSPSNEQADLLRHLRHDVEAIANTNDSDQRIVNCPTLIDLYDALDRHAYNRNSEVRNLVRRIEDDGASIYSQCGFRPDGDFRFEFFYRTWEETLQEIQQELSNTE